MKAPIFPQYDTLTGRALALLLQGKRISHRDFQNNSASYRLSSPIEVLRNDMHWPISDVWLEGLTNDKTGRRAKYKRYFISPEDLKGLRTQLGERLDKFISAVQRFEAGAVTPTHKAGRAGKGYEDQNLDVNHIKCSINPLGFYRHELPNAALKKQGWNDGGLCPFHADNSKGSFRVNFDTGAFKCYSCGYERR